MSQWELANKLYAAGYTHDEVRSVWVYAYHEQTLPEAGRRKKRWQAKALDEVKVNPLDVDFGLEKPVMGNYF